MLPSSSCSRRYMFPVGNAACATRAVSSGTGRIGLGCNDTASSPLSEFEPTYPHELLDRKTAERLGPISIRHQCQCWDWAHTGGTPCSKSSLLGTARNYWMGYISN